MSSGCSPENPTRTYCPSGLTRVVFLTLLGVLLTAQPIWAQFGGPGGPSPGGPSAGGGRKGPLANRRYITPLEDSDEVVNDVRFEGVETIVEKALMARIKTRPGTPLSSRQIREDVRILYNTRWFYSVEPRVEDTDYGPVVVFRVLERPIVQRVVYQGNEKYKDSYLDAITGLKKGSPYDIALNKEAAKRIERLYKDKGYFFVKVELLRGSDKNDREIVFNVVEGPKVVVSDIRFEGNEEISTGVLKTKLQTKTQKFWFFGGQYDPSTLTDDIAALKAYYHALGYFDVTIEKKAGFTDDNAHVIVDYTVNEGPRYRIRNIEIHGTEVITENSIRRNMKTLPGDYFTSRNLNEDISNVRQRYGELGRINANIEAIPRFLKTPGVIDLELVVDEDEVWRIRRINVHMTGSNGRPVSHTKESVVSNRMTVFPGDLANPLEIRKSEQRVNRGSLFENGPLNGPKIEFSPVPDSEMKFSQALQRPEGTVRGQNSDYYGQTPIPTQQNDDSVLVRSQNYERGIEQPGNLLWDSSPQGDPFGPALNTPPAPFVQYREGDLDVYVQEARTGRLMFGAGVNSDSGLVGNIVLDERNFDIFRPPTSFEDIVEGRAWRGGGQTFRLEAVPGDQVSRYTASWSDPYFLDTDVSLSLSGFYYQRYLDNWTEERTGGRATLGYQFTPELSGNVGLRVEQINLTTPFLAPPPQLAAAVGDNLLSTVRFNLAHDTRDSAFLPSEGHLVSAGYEQAFGDFSYPRVDLEASQYYTLWSRIDGQGKHILSFNGQVGWTGDDTPIFETFYAGGYSSFRGFEFRGVTPKVGGIEVGGMFQALGSIQYQVPVTADENIAVVAFTDFGTVEQSVGFDQFRASVGAGVRLMIPAMGPVPMAFDFAFPILSEPTDDEQVFAFYVGLTR